MNTKQFEFDAVVEHLFKQGKPALDINDKCSYRGDGGTMCAVGCRIPNEASMNATEAKNRTIAAKSTSGIINEIKKACDHGRSSLVQGYIKKDVCLALQKLGYGVRYVPYNENGYYIVEWSLNDHSRTS